MAALFTCFVLILLANSSTSETVEYGVVVEVETIHLLRRRRWFLQADDAGWDSQDIVSVRLADGAVVRVNRPRDLDVRPGQSVELRIRRNLLTRGREYHLH
ncbi:MAG: hypothetical protein AB7Q81_12530 [Gammaproteobacteria bacterium]